MNREEFLEVLNAQLEGEIPSNEISQHLAYYNRFIEQQLSQGQAEEQVLEKLGDPRLIAKTLIDTEDIPNVQGYRQSYAYSAEESDPEASRQEDFQKEDFRQEDRPPGRGRWLNLSTWHGKLILAAAALLGGFLLVTLIGALLPVMGVFLLAALIVSLINRRR